MDGFYPDLTCRGFQFQLGQTYKMPSLTEDGFNFCRYPTCVEIFDGPTIEHNDANVRFVDYVKKRYGKRLR